MLRKRSEMIGNRRKRLEPAGICAPRVRVRVPTQTPVGTPVELPRGGTIPEDGVGWRSQCGGCWRNWCGRGWCSRRGRYRAGVDRASVFDANETGAVGMDGGGAVDVDGVG